MSQTDKRSNGSMAQDDYCIDRNKESESIIVAEFADDEECASVEVSAEPTYDEICLLESEYGLSQ